MSLFSDTHTTQGIPAYTVAGNLPLQLWLRSQLAQAIAEFEGFWQPGSISRRLLNPGNIRPFGTQQGVETSAGLFRQFPTEKAGWDALVHQINLNLKRGLTLREFFLGKPGVYAGYSPLADNDEEVIENYIAYVADRVGLEPSINLQYYFPDLTKSPQFGGLKWVPPSF